MRALRKGEAVALVADQSARFGVLVPFFGVPASTARGPAVFALRAGSPLFLGVMRREAGWRPRYRFTLERIVFETTGDGERDVLAVTTAHTLALERAVQETPRQYFWQHNRWRQRRARSGAPEPPPDGSV